MPTRPLTIAAFHAHPDDEVLLTGGFLAAAAARGHRVVLVTATRGEAGLSGDGGALAATREAELRASARILGCGEVVVLGYPDSGMSGEHGHGFAHEPVAGPAAELVALLRAREVDVLVGYDRNGGYGHPDHQQVHRVARQAATELPDLWLLEATVDRRALGRAMWLVARLPFVHLTWDEQSLRHAFTRPGEITYTVDVRRYAGAKRRAMAAHASQRSGGGGERTLHLLCRLPRPLFRRALGTEWFVDPAHRAPRAVNLLDELDARRLPRGLRGVDPADR